MGFRKTTIGKFVWEYRCQVCGQFPVEGEDCYIIHPDGNAKIKFGLAHCKELDDVGNDEEKIKFLENKKIPRLKPWTEDQVNDDKIFQEVCRKFGFTIRTVSKNKRNIRYRKPRSSITISRDIITGYLKLNHKGNRGLFDWVFKSEILGKIENEFRKRKGLEEQEVITFNKVLSRAIEETDKLMRK